MSKSVRICAEIKINDKWNSYSVFSIVDYHVIRVIESLPYSESSGGLSDVADLMNKMNKDDFHSKVLSLSEIELLYESIKDLRVRRKIPEFYIMDNMPYLFGSYFGGFKKHREEYPPEIQDIRFLCWIED